MYNFEKICRTCSSSDQLQSLFNNYQSLFINAAQMLSETINITVLENDNFPQNMCTNCLDKLYSAYNFKQQCQETQKKYEEYLNNLYDDDKFDVDNDQVEQIYLIVKEDIDDKASIPNDGGDKQMINKKKNGKRKNVDDKTSDHNDGDDKQIINKKKNGKRKNIDDKTSNHIDEEKKLIENKQKKERQRQLCKICNKSYRILNDHIKTVHGNVKPFTCNVCNKRFSRCGDYKRHLMVHSGGAPKFPCPICGKHVAKLTNHIRTHTKESRFNCEICHQELSCKNNYKRHLRIHTGERFQCDMCERSFARIEQFKNHKRAHELYPSGEIPRLPTGPRGPTGPRLTTDPPKERKPPGEKKFLCSTCGKGFTQKQALEGHINLHTGARPHKCKLCEKAFATISAFNRHQYMHAGKRFKSQTEKRHKCSYCEKKFALKRSRINHENVHTGVKPFNCKICNERFRQTNHLVVHMRTHTGEKPYKCSFCDKRFAIKGNLTVHERIHTGEAPYVCDICTKGFTDSKRLKKHKLKYHSLTANEEQKINKESFDLDFVKIDKSFVQE